MICGTYTNTIDDGRLTIPAKFKDALLGEVVIRYYNADIGCLQVYSHMRLECLMEKELEKATNEFEYRNISNKYLISTTSARVDGQGRMSIPKEKLDMLGIENQVVISGCFDHIEIWKPEDYERYRDKLEDEIRIDSQIITAKANKERKMAMSENY